LIEPVVLVGGDGGRGVHSGGSWYRGQFLKSLSAPLLPSRPL
jgi:hypothetical protein